ncbi:MAG: PEPxxWA-CTERM sorting domain-containing protein [Phenylobacterium sp.]
MPEPASWSLMILGFGGLGAVLRRRRGRAAVATA